MIGKWTFTGNGSAGITSVTLEVELQHPIFTMGEAMQLLADTADIEADKTQVDSP